MIYQGLNKNQLEAVDCAGGPILIVAGAGSGKTRTLTGRLFKILKSGVPPENVVAITFTNKAADEMRNRVLAYDLRPTTNVVGHRSSVAGPFIGTFHSFGAKILKAEARLVGRSRNFSIFDGDDSLRLIKNIVKNFNLERELKDKFNPPFLRKEFSRVKSELSDVKNEDEAISYFFNEYENALRRNNAFDFDDLIQKPVEIFQNNAAILEKYQNKFHHILVDEFQDTNTAQYVLIKLLAQKHRNLSAVGDDAQSIYAFRHSDFKIFLNFERDWPETKVVLLEQNYRSSGNIIKAASSLIAKNKFQKPKNLWTENADGELVKMVEHQNEDEEAEWIARQISNDNFSDKSVAVLYRTNAQSRAIESALIERGISYKIFGGVKFYERKEIRDIVAVLRWAANQKDAVSFERMKSSFLKKPFLRIQREIPPAADETPPAKLIGFILEITDYLNQLKRRYDNFRERAENINELIYYASEFGDLRDFLEKISLFQSSDLSPNLGRLAASDSRFAVNLMTVHLAKGLEFDAVFIAGCNEGLLPHQMAYYSDLEIEEERRLMYVAMTRAKKELFLNFYNLPSRFLREIPPEFIEFFGDRTLEDEERYITID